MNVTDYQESTGEVIAIGQKPDGTPSLINVDADGNLITGLEFTGDITLGVVQIDQTTANANEVVVKTSALPTGAATQTTLASVLSKIIAAPATEAKQDTINTSIGAINAKITACNTGAVTVAASALPTGAATAAKQPALGTAGTSSTDVITVQGIASGTAQPVSGTVTATPPSATLSSPVSDYENSRVVSASACKLVMLCGYNSGPAQWIQIFNSATVPANNAVPVVSYGIPSQSSFQIPIPVSGLPLSTGCSWSNSSAGNKKTIGSADCFVTAVIL